MAVMAKERKPKKPRPPSRENTRYVAIPLGMYNGLAAYAKSRSDADDTKSVSWAGRVAIRRFLVENGINPTTGKPV